MFSMVNLPPIAKTGVGIGEGDEVTVGSGAGVAVRTGAIVPISCAGADCGLTLPPGEEQPEKARRNMNNSIEIRHIGLLMVTILSCLDAGKTIEYFPHGPSINKLLSLNNNPSINSQARHILF